jgi:hypothetical protein
VDASDTSADLARFGPGDRSSGLRGARRWVHHDLQSRKRLRSGYGWSAVSDDEINHAELLATVIGKTVATAYPIADQDGVLFTFDDGSMLTIACRTGGGLRLNTIAAGS